MQTKELTFTKGDISILWIRKSKKRGDGKSVLLSTKKNIDKKWEDELSRWMIEDFFTPYQAS